MNEVNNYMVQVGDATILVTADNVKIRDDFNVIIFSNIGALVAIFKNYDAFWLVA